MSLIAGNLGIIQRLLDEHQIVWGIYGGAAVHVYGNRRPIRNIDILLPSGQLSNVSNVMKQAKRVAQFDGRRIMWSGITLCDDLSVRQGGNYPFKMDQEMIDRLQRMPLLGSQVRLLSPEDVLVHKMLLSIHAEAGNKDFDDALDVVQRQQRQEKIDTTYIQQRIRTSNALEQLKPRLIEWALL